MLALEGMMNAQRNRGMYRRVGERLAEIRKSRKISQAKLAKLLGVVEGTIQNTVRTVSADSLIDDTTHQPYSSPGSRSTEKRWNA
jgi:transcriptional regulator with XRE-family HTH domain